MPHDESLELVVARNLAKGGDESRREARCLLGLRCESIQHMQRDMLLKMLGKLSGNLLPFFGAAANGSIH